MLMQDILIQKIQDKNVTLRLHISKMESQLKQKEEQGNYRACLVIFYDFKMIVFTGSRFILSGDALHSIDFHQLQIENNQYNQV